MGLCLKVAAVPCLIILLSSAVSYSLFSQANAQYSSITVQTDKPTYHLGEKVTISGTAITPTGQHTANVTVDILDPSGNLYLTEKATPSQCQQCKYEQYTVTVEIGAGSVSGTYTVKASYYGDTATATFTYDSSISISTDKNVYGESERICVDGEGVPKDWLLPALKLYSGDGAYYEAEFPESDNGKFRTCFTPTSYSSNFAYGVWVVNFEYLEKTYANTTFVLLPSQINVKEAENRLNMTGYGLTAPGGGLCYQGKINVRSDWHVLVLLYAANGTVIEVNTPTVSSYVFSGCTHKYVDAGKIAMLDPSGVFYVKDFDFRLPNSTPVPQYGGGNPKVSTDKASYIVGETVTIAGNGFVRDPYKETGSIIVLNSEGLEYADVPFILNYDGTFTAKFGIKDDKLATEGVWKIRALYDVGLGESAENTFTVSKKPQIEKPNVEHKVNLSDVKVQAKQIKDIVILRVRTMGNVGIDGFKILSDSTIKSAKGPRGWSEAVENTNMVQFSTTQPLPPSGKAYFLLKVGEGKATIDWKAYGNGNVIGEGSVTPIVR